MSTKTPALKRPTLKRGPAAAYQGPTELIMEAWAPSLRIGCLLTLREAEVDGQPRLLIEPYRADDGVLLRVGGRDVSVKQAQGRYTADDDVRDREIGEKLVALLGLRKKPHTEPHRYDTAEGDKTTMGLARLVRRVIEGEL
jgi:hypothetical protein